MAKPNSTATRVAAVVALLAVVATICLVWWNSGRTRTPTGPQVANTTTSQETGLPMQVAVPPVAGTTSAGIPSDLPVGEVNPADPTLPPTTQNSPFAPTSSTATTTARQTTAPPPPRGTTRSPSSPASPTTTTTKPPVLTRAQQVLGQPLSGLPWHSGVLLDTTKANVLALSEFSQWRTRKLDVVNSNPKLVRLEDMGEFAAKYSGPIVQGFEGRMVLQLPMVANETQEDVNAEPINNIKYVDISAGKYDAMWEAIAKSLVANGRGNSLINMGTDVGTQGKGLGEMPNENKEFIQAYRHVAGIFKKQSSDLKFVFSTNCTRSKRSEIVPYLPAPYTVMPFEDFYPGDDVVDVVGCSLMDLKFESGASTEAEWKEVLSPSDPYAVGLQRVSDYARKKNKGFALTTWYLMPAYVMGNGDNPFFVQKMYDFFQANKDILVYESLGQTGGEQSLDDGQTLEGTNDPTTLIKGQMPKSADLYRKLWGK
jgi:hypothetical protein